MHTSVVYGASGLYMPGTHLLHVEGDVERMQHMVHHACRVNEALGEWKEGRREWRRRGGGVKGRSG